MADPFEVDLWSIFNKYVGKKEGAIVKCAVCGQKNRLAASTEKLIRGPLGPKCGCCKQPLAT